MSLHSLPANCLQSLKRKPALKLGDFLRFNIPEPLEHASGNHRGSTYGPYFWISRDKLHDRLGHSCCLIGSVRQWSLFSQVQNRKTLAMLYTIAVVLILLWLLGMVSSFTINGFIHILLVIAIVVVLLRIISGRKPI
jgi:hypothetical protein